MDVYVIGAGGHAKVVVATLQACGHRVRGLFDDDAGKHGRQVLDVPVLGPVATVMEKEGAVVMAIGSNTIRKRVVEQLEGKVQWATAVHPTAYVHETVTLGPGAVVFAGAVVQPDVRIGMHAIVNTGATIDHDSILGDYVHVAPGAHLAGQVRIDEGAFVGIGASVIPSVHLGAWSVIGAGTTVIGDVPPHVTAVGTPARIVRTEA